jgi:hypothetical protein
VGSADACTFDAKLNNAALAGAQAAIIYDSADEPLIDYATDEQLWLQQLSTAIPPVLFISRSDGLSLKGQIQSNAGIQATLDFDGLTTVSRPSNIVSFFSSIGPSPGGAAKPDLVAVGNDVVSADLVSAGRYALWSGTSESAPLVSGSLAILEAARPGLTAAQYRSLIVNSAPVLLLSPSGAQAAPQTAGSGRLDMLNALQNNLAASPTVINFRARSGTSVSVSQTITFTNVGLASDTFTVVVNALNAGGPAPSVDVPTFTLAPGASQKVLVSLSGSNLAPGQYHGFLAVTGAQTSVATRLAYWLGVPGNAIQQISVLYAPEISSTGTVESMYLRFTDMIGVPLDGPLPAVTTQNPRARVINVYPAGDVPGTYGADIVIGRPDAQGFNTFTVTSGSVTAQVVIQLQ